MPFTIGQMVHLFRTEGSTREGIKEVSQEQHALQRARLAAQACAALELIAAALLHGPVRNGKKMIAPAVGEARRGWINA
jgi:predicted HD phosphohydrolase